MFKRIVLCGLVLAIGGMVWAQNPGTQDAGSQAVGNPIDWFPVYTSPADINAYFASGLSGGLTVEATDACRGGDIWQNIVIGLPGPVIQTANTNGSAEGCACTHSGGYDARVDVAAGSAAIVIQRLAGGNGDTLRSELRMTSGGLFQAVQIRGSDACGVQ